jgi:hypothetical protein
MWDLQRNGGNVVATTERILSGRGLEVVSPGRFFGPAQLVDLLLRDTAASFWTVSTSVHANGLLL